ncbi:MAG TPA: MBL fold metallo-hydrolase [Candidatus Saccharimonadales bacterium]|nr:MBL fold metallo-hydrolase [Candidatus Saccharimonadales bacterium]
MKLTKYGHACMTLEEQSKKLLIDPGVMTPNIGEVNDIVAVVVTHEHADHLNLAHLAQVAQANPDVKIFTPSDAAKKLQGLPATTVKAGDKLQVGPFQLVFYGEKHAEVHEHVPMCDNVGVLVNDNFYFPGDSFTKPGVPVKTLALPISGPWLKTGEVIDYLDAVKPTSTFPTHDGMLSAGGKQMYEAWTQQTCEKHGITWFALEPGESKEI